MAKAHYFTDFRLKNQTIITHTSSPIRKVGHSFQQGARQTASNLGNAIQAPFAGKNKIAGAGNLAAEAANKTNVAGGFLVGTVATLAIAGSTAAWVAAVTGPQVAVTASVISLAMMLREAYSNREAAHEALRPFVYSLVDDEPPSRAGDYNKAAAAAAYLFKEAEAQLAQLGNKLKQRENDFNEYIIEYEKKAFILRYKKTNNWIGDDVISKFQRRQSIPPADRGKLDFELESLVDKCIDAWSGISAMREKAEREGGAVFEFIRRVEHVGNYLQCCSIINTAIIMKLNSQNTPTNPSVDPLLSWQGAQQYRQKFKIIGEKMNEAEQNFHKLSIFYNYNRGVIGT